MKPLDKYILGTVQLGLDYGINNAGGKPELATAHAMLSAAWDAGVRKLDTAEVYGDAHSVIGAFHQANPDKKFQVVTKFLVENLRKTSAAAHLAVTLQALNIDKLYGWMFHNPAEFDGDAALLDELVALKESGKVSRLGVSVYSNADVQRVADAGVFDLIQMPFNLLDNGTARRPALEAAKKAGIEVHIRSAFLQGVFFMPSTDLSDRMKPLASYLDEIGRISNRHSVSVAQLAMGYPFHHAAIDGVVIGTDNVQQIHQNIETLQQPFPAQAVAEVEQINVVERELLNPSNWNN